MLAEVQQQEAIHVGKHAIMAIIANKSGSPPKNINVETIGLDDTIEYSYLISEGLPFCTKSMILFVSFII